MKTHLMLALLTAATLHAAVPAKDDAALAKLLNTPDGVQFTAAFARFLLDLPPAEIPVFRANLTAGLLEKTLPRRHAWNALGLTDTRWAEVDPRGFIAACENGLKEVPPVGLRFALLRIAATDPAEAIRVWRDLKLDQDRSFYTAGLFGQLAAKDPQRAIAMFNELPPPHHGTEPVATAMVQTWLDAGIDVAWQHLNELPPPPEYQPFDRQALVCVAAARQDPAKAISLLESVAAEKDRAGIQTALFYRLGHTEAPLALELARRINTAAAWKNFASSARFGSDENTLRQLLAVLPADQLEPSLTAFFTADDPVAPAFSNACVLSLLPDAAMRRAMLVAIVEAGETRMRPLPLAVVDAASAIGPGVFDPPTPEPVAKKLLAGMLARNPLALLPWMREMSQAKWNEQSSQIRYDWPISRLAEDAVTLLAGNHPRERALGEALAERWLSADPLAAFLALRDKAPDLASQLFDPAVLVKHSGGDSKKALEMLAGISDESARQAAQQRFTLWQSKRLQPSEAPESVQQKRDEPPLPTWDDALKLGFATAEGRSLGVATIRRMAAIDPQAAMAALIKAGESALQPDFLQPVMQRLTPDDPPAAFETALRLPPQFGRPLIASIVNEWLRSDPSAACTACAKLPPYQGQEYLLTNAVNEWTRKEPTAALAWIDALPPGPQRAECMATAIGQLRETQPQRAVELFVANRKLLADHAKSRVGDLAIGIAQRLADFQYQSGCEVLETIAADCSEPPIRQHWQTHLLNWLAADPTSATAYLKSRAEMPLAKTLMVGLDKELPPRHRTEIASLLPAEPKSTASPQLRDAPANARDESLAGLLALPPLERVAQLGWLVSRGGTLDDAMIEDILPPAEGHSVSDLTGQIITALAVSHLNDALQAASQLQVTSADSQVRRILTNFADPQAAAAAIDEAIADPVAAARARAWLECLPAGATHRQ